MTLTQEQREHFLEKGYIVLRDCFTKEDAAHMLENVWIRLGMDPNDQSTWTRERVNMPWHRRVKVKEFAPKVYDAICELLGGEDRVDENSTDWGDSIIVNLGTDEYTGVEKWQEPRDLDGWHCDGDFFRHYLDSPEQALLLTPIFSDEIKPKGGGTMMAVDGLSMIAKHLAAHPEGVNPRDFDAQKKINECKEFVEMTGKVGDCCLMHPFMLHSASRNSLRVPRFIINPKVSVKEPFRFDRDPKDLSLVEQKTLKCLGVDRYEFKPTGSRDIILPARENIWKEVRMEEMARVEAHRQVVAAK